MKKGIKNWCEWVGNDIQMIHYHDVVWGVPKKKDIDIFEAIVLDTFQTGLSWKIILHKRDAFAKAFFYFDPKKVSRMKLPLVKKLLENSAIVRHRGKIEATIQNAKSFLAIQKEFGSFSKYIWNYTRNKVIVKKPKTIQDIPKYDELALIISKDMKNRGFRFFGPTVCYAFLQGIGIISEHTKQCWKRK